MTATQESNLSGTARAALLMLPLSQQVCSAPHTETRG